MSALPSESETMLKKYRLPSVKGEGWAFIVIDTDVGFFSTVSDWGNYAFCWTHPGCEFRAFLIQLDEGYLYSKLMHGRKQDVFDEAATVKGVKEAILEARRCQAWSKERAREEWELLEFHLSDGEAGFNRWADHTQLDEYWEFHKRKDAGDCHGFCKNIFPRFQQILRDELVNEVKEVAWATEASASP